MQIKDCIQRVLDPLGVMVVIEAQHMCMQMRGVEKQNSLTTTSDFTGFFQQAKTREEKLIASQAAEIAALKAQVKALKALGALAGGGPSAHHRRPRSRRGSR